MVLTRIGEWPKSSANIKTEINEDMGIVYVSATENASEILREKITTGTLLVYTPIVPATSTNHRNEPTCDPLEPFGRAFDEYHPRVRQIPYHPQRPSSVIPTSVLVTADIIAVLICDPTTISGSHCSDSKAAVELNQGANLSSQILFLNSLFAKLQNLELDDAISPDLALVIVTIGKSPKMIPDGYGFPAFNTIACPSGSNFDLTGVVYKLFDHGTTEHVTSSRQESPDIKDRMETQLTLG